MSVPFEIYSCETCGDLTTSQRLHHVYLWRDEYDRECHFLVMMGVCHECEDVVAMEKLPDPSDYAEACLLAGLSERDKKSRRKDIDDAPWGSARYAALNDAPAFQVMKRVMTLRAMPVCLDCGSTNVSAFPETPPEDGFADGEEAFTGCFHPGCGGRITVKGSGDLREWSLPKELVYSISGERLEMRDGALPEVELTGVSKLPRLARWLRSSVLGPSRTDE